MKARTVSRTTVIGVLLLALVSIVLLRTDSSSATLVEEEMLEPGDIIFVDLYDGWCHVGRWDHMALYVGEQPYAGVVEATYNGGICYTPLGAFLARDEPAVMSVRRPDNMPGRDEIIQEAIEYAMAQVGKTFDFTATATIPLKANEENLHCAEVVWRAYESAGVDLDSNGTLFLYPDDIYYSPKLRPV
jgi:uncharacterized protein YycO